MITKDDLEKHGYSARCPGCQAVLRGTARQGHSKGCRERLEKEMEGMDKAETAKRKFGDFMDAALEKEDGNRKRKAERREEEQVREGVQHQASGSGTSEEERKRDLEAVRQREETQRPIVEQTTGEKERARRSAR